MKPELVWPAAGEAGHALDRRIGPHDLDELAELPAHRLEGDALVGADAADDAARVLLRKEALGDRDVEMDVEQHRRQEDEHGEQRMAQHQPEAAAIEALQATQAAFAQAGQETGLAMRSPGGRST